MASGDNTFARRMATSDLTLWLYPVALSGHMDPRIWFDHRGDAVSESTPRLGLSEVLRAQTCMVTTTSIIPPPSILLSTFQLPIRFLRDPRHRQNVSKVVALLIREQTLSHLERFNLCLRVIFLRRHQRRYFVHDAPPVFSPGLVRHNPRK